ncbi:hypothetical protein ACFL57_03140 [Candidatus Margulisiibacteriota bacterium]
MSAEEVSVATFINKYWIKVRRNNLIYLKFFNEEKLKSVSRIEKVQLHSLKDIVNMGSYYLVWYRNSHNERVEYIDPEARNITVEEKSKMDLKSSPDEDIQEMLIEFENGADKDIDIVVVHDSLLDKSVILDGNHRLSVLYYYCLNDIEKLKAILSSGFSINVITFFSPLSSTIFFLDFMNICRDVYQERQSKKRSLSK